MSSAVASVQTDCVRTLSGRWSYYQYTRTCSASQLYELIDEKIGFGGYKDYLDLMVVHKADNMDYAIDDGLKGRITSQTIGELEVLMVVGSQCQQVELAGYCYDSYCSYNGKCHRVPYSKENFCNCNIGYDGNQCEYKNK